MNGLDEEGSMNAKLTDRCLTPDYLIFKPRGSTLDFIDEHPRDKRRIFITHFPFNLLPPDLLDKAKVVFVGRNPKDAVVSWFHYMKNTRHYFGYDGDLEQLADLYMKGQTSYGDYWHTLNQAWSLRYHPNLKFMWFEDMKKDLVPVIKDLCYFLTCPLSSEKIETLNTWMQIDNVRRRYVASAENDLEREFRAKFIRKGKVGDWRNHFSEDLNKRFDEWIEKNNTMKIPFQFQ